VVYTKSRILRDFVFVFCFFWCVKGKSIGSDVVLDHVDVYYIGKNSLNILECYTGGKSHTELEENEGYEG